MGLFSAINTSASGLTAERLRMDVISDNLANVNTTRTEDGGPYMRKVVSLEPRNGDSTFPSISSLVPGESANKEAGNGVRVRGIVEAEGEPKRTYSPQHPDANEEGYVLKPNVEPVKEMVDMITASRAYQANTTAISTSKKMFKQGLNIAR